ncbi:MAG: hypothetical protein A2Y12_11790 [Planctomycetes bacterium GWF2_42_9]|nr:MAG: hypothetical protein A2Y12_11790 [Planctomycetes bacterium GWF2_42_9]
MALNDVKCSFIQDGKSIDYTPASTAVEAGDLVVIGDMVGIAKLAIPVGKLGALAVEGVFEMPTGEALTQGAKVYLIAATGLITATATSNIPLGHVWSDSYAASSAPFGALYFRVPLFLKLAISTGTPQSPVDFQYLVFLILKRLRSVVK